MSQSVNQISLFGLMESVSESNIAFWTYGVLLTREPLNYYISIYMVQ